MTPSTTPRMMASVILSSATGSVEVAGATAMAEASAGAGIFDGGFSIFDSAEAHGARAKVRRRKRFRTGRWFQFRLARANLFAAWAGGG